MNFVFCRQQEELCEIRNLIDRDLNAASNLKNITFGTKENYACGDTAVGDLAYDKSSHGSSLSHRHLRLPTRIREVGT